MCWSKLEYRIWFEVAEIIILHFASGHSRPPTLRVLSAELGISINAAQKVRKAALGELYLDRGGLLGATVCSKRKRTFPAKSSS